MERATKAVQNAGIEKARIVMDLAHGRIEVIIGESGSTPPPEENPWDDI
jgi:hypothetical protein